MSLFLETSDPMCTGTVHYYRMCRSGHSSWYNINVHECAGNVNWIVANASLYMYV